MSADELRPLRTTAAVGLISHGRLPVGAGLPARDSVASHRIQGCCSGLLNYIHTSVDADDVLVSKISCAVKSANSDAEWRESAVGFMTVEHSHRVALRDAHREGLTEGLERGLAEGIDRGRQEGLKQGEARGMIRGEARFGKLADILLDEKRIDDLKRAADDAAYRDSLFQEYGL